MTPIRFKSQFSCRSLGLLRAVLEIRKMLVFNWQLWLECVCVCVCVQNHSGESLCPKVRQGSIPACLQGQITLHFSVDCVALGLT